MNKEVEILRYVTKESFDAYSWQLIETKQKFISQIYRGDTSIRKLEDLDNSTMNYAQIKAIASGNPMILEKFKVDTEVQKIQDKQRNFKATKYKLEDSLNKTIPALINATKSKIERIKETVILRKEKQEEENCNIEIDNKEFNTYKDAGAEILEFSNKYMELNKEYHLGNYRGFELTMTNVGADSLFDNNGEARKVIKIKGKFEISFDMLKVPSLNIKKIDEKIDELELIKDSEESKLEDLYRQEIECKKELEKPFEFAEKLELLLKRKNEIDNELKLDDDKNEKIIVDEKQIEESEKSEYTEDSEYEETEEYLEKEEEDEMYE